MKPIYLSLYFLLRSVCLSVFLLPSNISLPHFFISLNPLYISISLLSFSLQYLYLCFSLSISLNRIYIFPSLFLHFSLKISAFSLSIFYPQIYLYLSLSVSLTPIYIWIYLYFFFSTIYIFLSLSSLISVQLARLMNVLLEYVSTSLRYPLYFYNMFQKFVHFYLANILWNLDITFWNQHLDLNSKSFLITMKNAN